MNTIVILILILVTLFLLRGKEAYRTDYRYGFVDTNPVRRTSQFFDTCSPENMADCSRNHPYEGLPLP